MNPKIISGMQVGADTAGLIAARRVGFETGGFAPKGFKTKYGCNKKFAEEYGLTEWHEEGYKERTWANVERGDLTIRLATNFKSAGEKCTLNAINHYKKPYIDVDLNNPPPISDVFNRIKAINPQVINIAGNIEVYQAALLYLLPLFYLIKSDGENSEIVS